MFQSKILSRLSHVIRDEMIKYWICASVFLFRSAAVGHHSVLLCTQRPPAWVRSAGDCASVQANMYRGNKGLQKRPESGLCSADFDTSLPNVSRAVRDYSCVPQGSIRGPGRS